MIESVKKWDLVWVAGMVDAKTGKVFSAECHRVSALHANAVSLVYPSECLGGRDWVAYDELFRTGDEAVIAARRSIVAKAEAMEAAAREIRSVAENPQFRPNFGTASSK